MTVVGSEKMVVYDDVSTDAQIMIYDKGVTEKRLDAALRVARPSYETFGEFQLLLRAGDVLIPKIDFVEPLAVECQHFVDCIRSGERAADRWQGGAPGREVTRVRAVLALRWPPVIAIVDHGMGNLGSVQNMLQTLGAQSIRTADPVEIGRGRQDRPGWDRGV